MIPQKKVNTIGVSNIVIVSLKDALLICHRNQTDQIKDLFNRLKDA